MGYLPFVAIHAPEVFFTRDAANMRAYLTGQHLIKTDTAEIIANVDEVMVMPQS